ncbi:T9SS type A sorting domain-containing protein [Flavobacterium sp. DG1-102-2]|uniref:GEVED domain-containing protein n=1 Tax=Flavobacterium sp. DG1-102-2 TaxID=3081663 RepID=UPI00294971CC|nr:GEVED domain-containing protein [Flavobacterium sp. DG1-102-2]MDV6167871.1 T9SS type A sorting domain-containing protein [Flavobacterium sp. DG1-102-2]
MKKKLQLIISCFMILLALVTGSKSNAQINYSQNFNVDAGGWGDLDFYPGTFQACEGSALRGEFVFIDYGDGFVYDYSAETVSPTLGTSNGLPVTLTYSYKLFDYYEYDVLTNNTDWGAVTVSYSASPTGPWTTLHTINPTNHISSASCAVKTATFTPAAGTPVYLRVYGNHSGLDGTDVLVTIDNVTAVQQLPACTGAPAASSAALLNGPVCNQQNASLALTPAYTASGLSYQWQGSANGTTYTNIAGATSATLSAPVAAGPWFRAVITCTASGATATSAAVQATSSGTNCTPCAVTFTNTIEPITSVSFSNLTNTSPAATAGAPAMQDFTALAPANVTTGQAYTFSAQGNTDGGFTDYFKVFIDFNKNGNLNDPGESFEIGFVSGSTGIDGQTASASIFIPTNASAGITLMRVYKLWNAYPSGPCATGGYGQVEDYLVNITQCTTVAPTATAAQTVCPGATVAALTATGTAIKWYTVASGGTPLAATAALTNNTTYYASQTIGCEGSARVAVAVTFTVVPVDDPADVTACITYTLPALTNGVYRTATNGGGTVLAAGSTVNATTTLYVYNTVGTCSAENSFLITVSNPVAANPDDVTACGSYTLPALTGGTYYTAAGGGGIALPAGTVITQSATLYVYAGNAACNTENSFVITINNAVADDPADVSNCGPYVLPALTNGNYFTEAGGQGDALAAGDLVEATATLYVYTSTGTATSPCVAENSFVITITNAEVDELDDVTVCGSYTLPEITNGTYYTGGSGLGDMLEAGDVITSTNTIHIYNAVSATCTAESTFTVTVVSAEADEMEDVTVNCAGYTLPVLNSGNTYYTAAEGTGTALNAGDVITSNQTIYIYAVANSATTTCTAESSFTVTVTEVEPLDDVTVTIEDQGGMPVVHTISEIVVAPAIDGIITFYATEEDAQNGINPLTGTTEISGTTVTYYATITQGDCSSEPFSVTVTIVLGNDKFDAAAFKYYPNPSSDVLNLSYSSTITSFTMYDMLGKKIMEMSINDANAQIDLSKVAAGTYIGKVTTENGNKTFKVVKNK